MTPKTKKNLGAVLLVLTAIVTLGVGVALFLHLRRTPPPLPNSADQIVALVTSSDFGDMTEAQRRPYMQRIVHLVEGMSLADRMKLLKQAMDLAKNHPEIQDTLMKSQLDFMEARARNFVLSDAATRKKMLDADIDRMEMMRKLRDLAGAATGGNSTPPPPPSSGPPGGDDFKKQMFASIQNGNPQSQAYIAEYFQAVRARRTQRGLNPSPMGR